MTKPRSPDLRAVRALYNHMLRGYRDYMDRTPWANAPMTEDECLHAPETAEQQAYWEGYNAAMLDKVAPVFRAAREGKEQG